MLKPYQHEGAAFLAAHTRALLADEPGLGKCAQSVEAAKLIRARTVLIVAPAIAKYHWQREWAKWDDRAAPVIPSVLSYNDAADERNWNKGEPWDLLIVDESHYAKNPFAQRTKAIFGKGGVAYAAKRIWCLTGTPTPNNPAELWVILRAFGVTGLDYGSFTERYCILDQNGYIRGARRDMMRELRELTTPYVLRRYAKDVMPEVEMQIEEYAVKPSTEWLSLIGVANMDLTGERTIASAKKEEAALRERLEKAANDDELMEILRPGHGVEYLSLYRRYLALLKAPGVCDLVKFEIENGLVDKLVIYGYHVAPMRLMAQTLRDAGIRTEFIYGGTPPKTRDAAIGRFTRVKGGSPVLLANMVAAGTAIDLTAAHEGIMFEMDWTPAVNAQAMLRMRRHGQKHRVRMRVMVAGGTLDERISAVVARKTNDIVALWE